MSIAHLAIDLGASSGRAIVGVLEGCPSRLRLEEVHRFEHSSCPTPTGPVWDLTGIWKNILQGLGQAASWCRSHNFVLTSIGVDTWGVDWALVGKSGELLALPHCYRDPQNDAACQSVLETLGGFEPLYERTGIQLMPFNTLFQVAARFQQEPRLFAAAETLFFLPDLFHYWLSGRLSTERTIASTSSMLNVKTGQWDKELLTQLGLPTHILGPIVEPGTELGTLRKEVAEATGASADIHVIAPASHDTASAVAAVPAEPDAKWAYLSSGTWSLLGAELSSPINSAVARGVPFTNEHGVGGTIRFLKNIAGLWLVQEARRGLQLQGDKRSFAELVDAAHQSEQGRTLVDPNHSEFVAPGDIESKISRLAQATGQPAPESAGQLIRCCLDSLAMCYAQTLEQLEAVLDHPIEVLHLVGGGSQNQLLNQLTCDAIGKPVVTGPVEATAIGNVLLQAIGCGQLADLHELRGVVARSFSPQRIEPSNESQLRKMRAKYDEITSAQ